MFENFTIINFPQFDPNLKATTFDQKVKNLPNVFLHVPLLFKKYMYKLEKDKVLNSVLLERHSIVSVVLEKNINKNNKILDQEMEIVILKEELSLKITYYGITLA